MIQQCKKNKFKKVLAIYLALMILLESLQPMQMYALTSGPTQPEFNSFTPIGTSDMVDLSSGDFNYNIPIMDVGGYPLNLSYNSGITMDQEASWVGLGWNLNVGQIERQVRGLPDDFRGDEMRYENDMRENVTIGTNFNASPAVFGKDFPFSLGLGVQYNNYEGITFKPSIGVSFSLSEQVGVGFNLSGSTGEGANVSPSVSISTGLTGKATGNSLSTSIGSSFNSRKGFENLNVSAAMNGNRYVTNDKLQQSKIIKNSSLGEVAGSISLNNTNNYTPTKRVAYDNTSSTFNATIGGEFYGVEGQFRITGYGSIQKINPKYKDRKVRAFGYENTQYKSNTEGVLDLNREKEQTFSKNTTSLAVTNYTYDTYNIEGQGISGMFRPFRSKVGYVYNDQVADFSSSKSFGAEFGFGGLVHGGTNFAVSNSVSSTGRWSKRNNALSYFAESDKDKNTPLYEQSAFKIIGELNLDNESEKTIMETPLRLNIVGTKFNRSLEPSYIIKSTPLSNAIPQPLSLSQPNLLKREGRLIRNQSVQKVTQTEADNKFVFKKNTSIAKPHHTVGMKVLQADGTTYNYGKSVYNTSKVEATFDVSGKGGDNRTGLVTYNGTTKNNGNGNSDHYVNKTTTPPYAHSYLISSILSTDYQDLKNDGPSDDDLGTYTKFDYLTPIDYQWRVPYGLDNASYNEGLKASGKDQKGSYIYGTKELIYLNKIETKTHIAFIDLEDRNDAMSVNGERGGQGNQKMKYIESIRLYAKSEVMENGIAVDPGKLSTIKPIKTAHFEYDYSLCKKIPASSTFNPLNADNPDYNQGKLTLKKVYFTYRNSNMGKYTPYKFDYSENNPGYDPKGFDVWGNFKENFSTGPTNSEFPFVEQDPTKAQENTSAWVLKKITLPSGGEMNVTTESDDYKYVQNKKAMQMFKVVGAGDSPTPVASTNVDDFLFSKNKILGYNHSEYLYVQVDSGVDKNTFTKKYLSENLKKPIYFKFLLNMTASGNKDFVSGYFEIDQDKLGDISVAGNLVSIPLQFLSLDSYINIINEDINPIAKAGWGFGRTYLNRLVYGNDDTESNKSFIAIVKDLVGSIKSMADVFKSPNGLLQRRGCAQKFDTTSSWIRLENPNGKKLGGGLRVSKIELSDNWDVMNADNDNSIYKENYGQEYTYLTEDGSSSSGVATFEPNASPENPFVEPLYGKGRGYADRISAPKELNYVEKPFGESFFPAPKVTYSRVTVTNLNKKNPADVNKIVKKHATGKVVTEHYTTYDFPTLVDYTELKMESDVLKSPLLKLLNVVSIDHLTASQGFSIETNDMNGKIKSEKVYAEGQNSPISNVDYKYNVGPDGKLDNKLVSINSKGAISKNLLGVHYDLINDFNESNMTMQTFGFDGNLATFLVAIFPAFVPTLFPRVAHNESILRTATTTKVTHKTGILIEKIAYDLGSRVSTKNLAWDANTGQVLLTQTINEFDDHYYNFNCPAYWYYANMGQASENIDLSGTLSNLSNNGNFGFQGFPSTSDISSLFKIGDELVFNDSDKTKLWVIGYSPSKNNIRLINREGVPINQTNTPSNLNFKLVRSANRNQQMASMASVTSMTNPIDIDGNGVLNNITDNSFTYTIFSAPLDKRNVINASAVEYSDVWKSQCENGLPDEFGIKPNDQGTITNASTPVNPFLYNTRGNWRAVKSHAYLAGRNNYQTQKRREAGFFVNFNPFYAVDNVGLWTIANTDLTGSTASNGGWTYASEVSQFSPYGQELENKDALNRYSSAQYGYKYTLPVAVASNARYSEIGFDGFEDYDIPNPYFKPHFGFSQNLITTDVQLSKNKSHTGKNSIAVKPGKKATFSRKINGCKETIINQ